ncbi:Eukaryotic translation initiation factor eIF-1 [Orbilia oligospora]|nr:Eukaryotic translation initiation factor eIF-1 [Orbilia oligospora]KAF3262660.1 Eukaryotic translation initiation factor eIF-1 [Orbilia oligospora]
MVLCWSIIINKLRPLFLPFSLSSSPLPLFLLLLFFSISSQRHHRHISALPFAAPPAAAFFLLFPSIQHLNSPVHLLLYCFRKLVVLCNPITKPPYFSHLPSTLRQIQEPFFRVTPKQTQFMSLDNLKSFDPFAETDGGDDKKDYIHIRIQQRNGRKTLTTIQGLPKEIDPKRVLKFAKKEFATNGSIVEDTELGEIIQLQGDQRQKISDLMMNSMGIKKSNIKIHGF